MNPCFTFNKLRRVIIVFPISAFFNYIFVALASLGYVTSKFVATNNEGVKILKDMVDLYL